MSIGKKFGSVFGRSSGKISSRRRTIFNEVCRGSFQFPQTTATFCSNPFYTNDSYCAASRKVAGSRCDEVNTFFQFI
jgi:hypothetical protein